MFPDVERERLNQQMDQVLNFCIINKCYHFYYIIIIVISFFIFNLVDESRRTTIEKRPKIVEGECM